MINATIPAPSHRSCSRRARVPSFHPSPMTKPLRRDVSWHDFRSPIHVNLWALLRPWRPPEHSFYEHTSAPTLSRNSPRRLSTDLIPKVALWYNAIHTNSYLSTFAPEVPCLCHEMKNRKVQWGAREEWRRGWHRAEDAGRRTVKISAVSTEPTSTCRGSARYTGMRDERGPPVNAGIIEHRPLSAIDSTPATSSMKVTCYGKGPPSRFIMGSIRGVCLSCALSDLLTGREEFLNNERVWGNSWSWFKCILDLGSLKRIWLHAQRLGIWYFLLFFFHYLTYLNVPVLVCDSGNFLKTYNNLNVPNCSRAFT